MTVAVIGGGIQGCTAALELSARRASVVLFEREPQLMQRASRWNEGKIHLGYTYANDPSLATARAMIRGALTFAARMRAYLERPILGDERSSPFVYGVHRDSLVDPASIQGYIAAVDRIVADDLSQTGSDYLGEVSLPAVRPLQPSESPFHPAYIQSAMATPELAVDTHSLADALADRVLADGKVSVLRNTGVASVGCADDGSYWLRDAHGELHRPFEAVVNASWDSRLALDATMGIAPPSTWLHRYKLALHGRQSGTRDAIPSVTVLLGPFGDVVNFGRRLYLSWYPAARIAVSREVAPGDPETELDDTDRSAIARDVVDALSRLVPALNTPDVAAGEFTVRGGHIFALGATDISDPRSRLHERHAVGVHSFGRFHSIDTGKYGLAPLHAVEVAERIVGA